MTWKGVGGWESGRTADDFVGNCCHIMYAMCHSLICWALTAVPVSQGNPNQTVDVRWDVFWAGESLFRDWETWSGEVDMQSAIQSIFFSLLFPVLEVQKHTFSFNLFLP